MIEFATPLGPIIAAKLFGGGGGGGEVTPAAVALAISQMTDAQASQALADLGYTVDAALNASSTDPVQNKVITLALSAAHEALAEKADAEKTEAVSGTTPTITPADNTVYNCGELTSLTISSTPASGAYSIVFTSGATATVTTFPATILGLDDFAAEADTVYEINVLDGRAVYKGWPLPAGE